MKSGTVKKFLVDQGYGFIAPGEGGPDVFFHVTQVVDPPRAALAEGDVVEFAIGEGRKGPEARAVSLLRPAE